MKNAFIKDKIADHYKLLLESNYLVREINLRNEIIRKDNEDSSCYSNENGYLAVFHEENYKWAKACFYIKPFTVLMELANVSVMYYGNPIVQYYVDIAGEWLNIEDGHSIDVRGDIRLRIWMNPSDIIFSISLVVPKSYSEPNYKIVKAIDFAADLIKGMPVKYNIDFEKCGKLNFAYENIYEIKTEDYESVIGDLKAEADGIKLVPNHEYDNSQGFSDGSYMIRRPIDKEIDFVYIELSKVQDLSILCILLINRPYNEVLKRIKNGQAEHSSEAFFDTGSKALMLSFHENNYISIADRYEDRDDYFYTNHKALDPRITIELSLRDNCIKINEENVCLSESADFVDKEFLYLWAAENQSMTSPGITINKVVYRKKSGYLYVKPFNNKLGSLKVLLLDNNEAYIEYFDKGSAQWERLDKDRILGEMDIKLRIKVNSKSEIYNVLFIKVD